MEQPNYPGFIESISRCYVMPNVIFGERSNPRVLPCCGAPTCEGLNPFDDQFNQNHDKSCEIKNNEERLEIFERFNIQNMPIPFITWKRFLNDVPVDDINEDTNEKTIEDKIRETIDNLENYNNKLQNPRNGLELDRLKRWFERWVYFLTNISKCSWCKGLEDDNDDEEEREERRELIIMICGYHVCVHCLRTIVAAIQNGETVDCKCDIFGRNFHNIDDFDYLALCLRNRIPYFTFMRLLKTHILNFPIPNNLGNKEYFNDT